MKVLIAYRFNELLKLIPELKKYKHNYIQDNDKVKAILKKFAPSENLKFIATPQTVAIGHALYYLFEKLPQVKK